MPTHSGEAIQPPEISREIRWSSHPQIEEDFPRAEFTGGGTRIPGIDSNQYCQRKGLSPRASLRLAIPILAGKPRNAPMPTDAGILPALASALGTPALPLRFRLCPFAAIGDGLVHALSAVSGDSSPERDHSPGSLSVAGSGRATPALPRYHLRRRLPSLTAVAYTPLPRLPARRLIPHRPTETARIGSACEKKPLKWANSFARISPT